MSYDVFISHSSMDKVVADAVVAGLEQESLRCWVAPRDVIPGSEWAAAIIEAIESAPVMVLVLSANSNGSPQVLREVERAVATNTIIVPFRIEDIDPSGAMAYYLATEHWLDALTPPVEAHIERLASSIRALLGTEQPDAVPPPAPAPAAVPSPATAGFNRRTLIVIGAAVLAALLFGGVAFVATGGGGDGDTATEVTAADEPAPTTSEVADEGAVSTGGSTTTTSPPPPMFEVPTGSLADVVQAGNRWVQVHDTDLAAVGDEVLGLARDSDGGLAALLESSSGEELAQLAAPALCQLTEDGVPPDDIAAMVAGAAAEVSGEATADHGFSQAAASVATASVCPERATEWTIATGGLGAGLLHSEDFEDGAPGWMTGSYQAGIITVEDGMLRLVPAETGYILGSPMRADDFPEAVVDVWVQQTGPASPFYSYGIACRETDTGEFGTFYMFAVLGSAEYEIWKYAADGTPTLLANGFSTAIHPAPTFNHLTVVCNGPQLGMLANGEVLARVSDPDFTEGRVSLWASTTIPGVEVVFDNLTIRSPSDEAASLLQAS